MGAGFPSHQRFYGPRPITWVRPGSCWATIRLATSAGQVARVPRAAKSRPRASAKRLDWPSDSLCNTGPRSAWCAWSRTRPARRSALAAVGNDPRVLLKEAPYESRSAFTASSSVGCRGQDEVRALGEEDGESDFNGTGHKKS